MTAGIAVCGIAWWLLGDTVAHYANRSQPAGVIRFAHYGGYRDFESWKRVIETFEQSHAGARIRQEYIPGYGTQYDNKIRRQLLAGVAPDVFMVQDESFPHYADTSLADLTDVIEEHTLLRLRSDLHPTATASFRYARRARPVLRFARPPRTEQDGQISRADRIAGIQISEARGARQT